MRTNELAAANHDLQLELVHHTETKRALRAAKGQADDANRSKTLFLANVSHELRTPLNAIIGFSDLMCKGLLGPIGNGKYGEYVKDIHVSAGHLLDLINDLMDVSTIEAGKFAISEGPVDLGETIGLVHRGLMDRLDKKALRFESHVADDLPPLRGDARRIRQILINLATNAIKFTPVGGTVRIDADRLASGEIRLRVSDTGVGIRKEDVQKAFELFGRIEGPYTRNQDGAGLGLSLVKSLADQHQASCQIHGATGGGTIVEVVFPADRALEPLRLVSTAVA